MSKDINKEKFTEETKIKLEIFAECFREWFPVFLHHPSIRQIHIYDFFAGSGKDIEGHPGSPLVLLKEAKGTDCKHCEALRNTGRPVVFHFNEKFKGKHALLQQAVNQAIAECEKEHCQFQCVFSYANYSQLEFKDAFSDESFISILSHGDYSKFILLDQYGFSQVDEDVFLKLVASPKTDFIFFISSSFIKRFKEHPATIKYFDTNAIPFDEARPQDCHRSIADYFQSLIPNNREYYLHNFTIKKGSNYWGLIFGSNHTLGMEKFLKVCWDKDEYSGESNFNIDDDWEKDTLFCQSGISNKRQQIKDEIRKLILAGKIQDNISGFKHVLRRRGLPKLFTEVVKELVETGEITRTGILNYASTNIHKVDKYIIQLRQKGGQL